MYDLYIYSRKEPRGGFNDFVQYSTDINYLKKKAEDVLYKNNHLFAHIVYDHKIITVGKLDIIGDKLQVFWK